MWKEVKASSRLPSGEGQAEGRLTGWSGCGTDELWHLARAQRGSDSWARPPGHASPGWVPGPRLRKRKGA